MSLSSLSGDVIVLNAWASWCEPCRAESPALASLASSTQPLGVRFVGLDEGDRQAPAKAFVATAGTTYPHIVDTDGTLLASLRLVPATAIPSTLVLDRSGHVAARVIGPIQPDSFGALVRRVAGEKS